MSLLDDVSIVVTPNGYNAGELYAVKPTYALGSEVMTNGVFNADDTSSWNGFYDSFTFTTDHYNLQRTAGDARVRKIFSPALIIGNMYIVEVVAKSASGDNILVGVTNSGDIQAELAVKTTSSSYQSFTHTFIAGANTTYATLWNGGSNSNVDYQSYSIKQVTSADMDVTRASAATRVDENGLVNYAEIVGGEEITNGDFATDSDWTKSSGWTISDGSANCLSGSGQVIKQINTLIIGKYYKLTLTVSNFVSGYIGSIGNDFGGVIAQANGLYEVLGTATSTDFGIVANGGFTGSIDNVSVKEVTRDNVPRIDYSGGGCPHILAEPLRTNLSNQNVSAWGVTNITKVLNDTTSPDGLNDGVKITATSEIQPRTEAGGGGVPVSDTKYSFSAFVKKGNTPYIALSRYSGSQSAIFNLDTKSIVTSSTENATIEEISNGWFKISITQTVLATDTYNLWKINLTNGSTTNVGVVGDYMYIWGGQVEVGSFSTSYIPTSGSTVTRVQDQFSRDGISSLINSEEGVLFVEMAALSDDLTYRIISLSDGTDAERLYIQYTSTTNQVSAVLKTGSSTQANIQHTLTDETVFSKMAFKWKANDFAFWIDGVEVGTDTSGSVPSGLNRLALDRQLNTNTFFGKVKQLQVYKTALSDEQLIQLTGTSGTDFYESYAEMASALTYTIQ